MNGKKGSSFEINISSNSKNKLPEMVKKSKETEVSFKGLISSVWEFCKEDSNRVVFSLKVGLAVLLVSLLILIQAPYQVFGTSIIWSILTVAIMFEYTVGATFNRGFNRALGSLLAGVLAICVAELALSAGRVAEPYVIGISIFFIGALTSFMKLWPKFVPYEYGFRVILFTYCLIIVSGYRMGSPIRTAMDRLYSIAIGGIVAVLVNILILPIWAGEQLHKELVNSFNAVADSLEGLLCSLTESPIERYTWGMTHTWAMSIISLLSFYTQIGDPIGDHIIFLNIEGVGQLQECVRKYLEDDSSDHPEFSKVVWDEFPDEPAYKKCKSTLNSSAKLESLANSAQWEPPHGRFRHFFYPWSEYVKVGAVLRYCAYGVMALHGVLHSEIQAPYNLRITFQAEIRDATTQAAELVRCLGKDVNSMKRTLNAILLKRVHISTERLQRAIDTHSYLLTSNHNAPEKPQHKLSQAPSANLQDFSYHVAVLDNATLPENSVSTQPRETQTETYHETMRKQMRRLYSWPSRKVDVFEEEGGFSTDFIPNLNALDSTRALSLATFTLLLIEFVARLDHLVQAVDELSKLAKFKNEDQ